MRPKATYVAPVGVLLLATFSLLALGQTGTTGALTGTTFDASRAVIPGVEVSITNEATGDVRTVVSGETGVYRAPLLPPGSYTVVATLPGFKVSSRSGLRVTVAETTRLDVQLELGNLAETVTVEAEAIMVQQENSALGRVASEVVVKSLPLATRNFTQILGLSPGIVADVTNAGELGRGSGSQATGRVSVHGSRSFDHNYQVDGIDANDFQLSVNGASVGTAVPNPDAIEEFKATTALADASFGRGAGAHVNVITKPGTNEYRGTLFHFFRNEALNANDFFFNSAGQPKPIFRQNQFGGTLGGAIKREKVFFFASYQGMHQKNGVDAGRASGNCSATVSSPPLTNDRSAAALGNMFAGRSGRQGGVSILRDGSNIHPVALRLLQAKNADGTYFLPTPQVIDPTQPFDRQGFSAFSRPCTFEENQVVSNFDILHTQKSKFAVRVFYAKSNQVATFTDANKNILGSEFIGVNRFLVASLAHSFVFSPTTFNEFRIGMYRNSRPITFTQTLGWPDIGVRGTEAMARNDVRFSITGSFNVGGGTDADIPQGNLVIQNHLSHVRAKSTWRFGGTMNRRHNNIRWGSGGMSGSLSFLSFPDFLLGQDGATNESGFSNIFSSSYSKGPGLDRNFRFSESSVYIQHDARVSPRLTLNMGLRYERLENPDDKLGYHFNFDVNRANRNAPASGTLEGWVVPSNFAGAVPAGVTKLDNERGLDGVGENTFAPRFGFALQPLNSSSRLILRGGYGMYYSGSTGQMYWQGLANGPIKINGNRTGLPNAAATFENPFLQPVPNSFPVWSESLYSPSTNLSVAAVSMDHRPARTEQYGLNIQTQFAGNYLLEVGYLGTRGTHMGRARSANQALLASPANPIRGITTNTVANVRNRVPILGYQAPGINQAESSGWSRYDSGELSLTKRMSRGVQFLASYTWSKNLDTSGASAQSAHNTSAGPGDQNDPRQTYGPSELSRARRLVFSYLFDINIFVNRRDALGLLLGGWSISGVTTFQTGRPLTILFTNPNNAYGITNDRAQLAPGCTHDNLVTPGNVKGKLRNYFRSDCFTTPVVIGDDGRATAFGNSGVGIVRGPGQGNMDMALAKRFQGWNDRSGLEFRAEFFNVLNTPQFRDPDLDRSSASFGQIRATSVNPRMMQLALKLTF